MQVPKPSKKKKLPSIPSLIKKADRLFSQFIRTRDSLRLQGKCCTCGRPGSEAGHFVKRSYHALRYNVGNVHLQCTRCNHFLDGNEAEYSRFIINTYGLHYFNWLMEQKQKPYKLTRQELEKVIEAYGK